MSWRARAVFVSGTFRDMHAERDLLGDQAFPALEEQLGQYFTTLERVDLRVGVETRGLADDHAKQALVLKVCLEDVKRCRPFLIVLVGDRYGWVPPIERSLAAATEAGFRTTLEGKSVTALEIEYGLWGDPDQQTRSRVYFRQLDYTGMDEAHAIVFSDERAAVSTLVSAEDRAKAAERAAALVAAKLRLRTDPELGPRCRNYTAGWDPATNKVTGLAAFVADVIQDLLPEMIAEAKEQVAAAGAGTLPTPLEQFVAERSRGFRGRSCVVAQLVAHATDPSKSDVRGRVVAGPSGGGKSAVFARVFEELSTRSGDDVWLLAHAAGIDPSSTSVASLLEDWVALLAGRLGIENPLTLAVERARAPGSVAIGDARPKPEEVFADLLARAAAKTRVVLLLDALDRFERTPQAEHVTWLPARLPVNVRLVATAVTGPESSALARRPDFVVEPLDALTRDEAREIAQSVYGRYHREPNQEAVGQLVATLRTDGAPAHGSALWLVSALEELNLLDGDDFQRAEAGTEGTDEDRLHAMVVGEARAMPGDVEALYARIFERAGRRVSDDAREGSALARAFATAVALSRGGLRELDLAALVPDVAALLDPSAPKLAWNTLSFASLRRVLRAHLVRRGEDDRWDFHHSQARAAADGQYVKDAELRRQLHATVAAHLLALPADDALRASEAMPHLIMADAPLGAARLYGGALSAEALLGCDTALASHARGADGLEWVIGLLDVEGLWDERDTLIGRYIWNLDQALTRANAVPQRLRLAREVGVRLRRLIRWHPESSRLPLVLSDALENIGQAALEGGDSGAAFEAFSEVLAIRRRAHSESKYPVEAGVAKALTQIAVVEMGRGRLDAAMEACQEALLIRRRLSDATIPASLEGLATGLHALGRISARQGDIHGAFSAFEEMLSIGRGLCATNWPGSEWLVAAALMDVGWTAFERGELLVALASFTETLSFRQRLAGSDHAASYRAVSSALGSIGQLELDRGHLQSAGDAFGESLAICRDLLDPSRPESLRDLAVALEQVGRVEQARGNLTGALKACRESLAITRQYAPEHGESARDLSVSLSIVAHIEQQLGNREAAGAAFAESLATIRAAGLEGSWSARDLSVALEEVGLFELSANHFDKADKCFAEMLSIRRRLADPARPESLRDLAVALHCVGRMELKRGRLPAASSAFAEHLALSHTLSDPSRPASFRDVAVALNYKGRVHRMLGDIGEARAAFEQSLAILAGLQRDGLFLAAWQDDIESAEQQLLGLDLDGTEF